MFRNFPIKALVLSFCCGLSFFNFALSPSIITSNRISFAILLSLTIFTMASNDVKKLKFFLLTPLLICSFMSISSLITSLIVEEGLWAFFSWLLLGVSSTLVAYNLASLKKEHVPIFWYSLLVACAILIFYQLYSSSFFNLVVSNTSGFEVRKILNIEMSAGLNRFNNALVLTFSLIIPLLVTANNSSKLVKLYAFTFISFCVFWGMYVSSRQTIFGILMALFPTMLVFRANSGWSEHKVKYSRLVILTILIVAGGVAAIAFGFLDWYVFEKRFFSSFESNSIEVAGDQKRIEVIGYGLISSMQNYGFGLGLGQFAETYGSATHNGFVNVLAEFGIIPGSVVILSLIALIFSLERRSKRGSGFISFSNKVSISSLMLIFFVMNSFNDLFREPILWSMIGVVIGMSTLNKSDNERV